MSETKPKAKPKRRAPAKPKVVSIDHLVDAGEAQIAAMEAEPIPGHNFAQLAMDARGLGMIGQALIKLPGLFQAAADMQAAVIRLELEKGQLDRERRGVAEEVEALKARKDALAQDVTEGENLLTEAHTAETERQLRQFRQEVEDEMRSLTDNLESARAAHQLEMEKMAERRRALEGEIAQIEHLVRQHQSGLGSLMQSVQAISTEG